MGFLKKLFTPLVSVDNKVSSLLNVVNIILALIVWHFLATGGLIPTPIRVGQSIFKVLAMPDFLDNLFTSLSLTLKGMGYSIIIALVICYLSLIPVFMPIAKFIIKCRYLTLTGLVFLFTLLTSNGHNLKMSLLLFGIVPFFVTSFLSIIDAINDQEYDLCKTLRMNNWQTLWEVVIAGRLDQVLEVMRQNFAIAWIMITSVEGLNMSEGGLGTMMIKSNKYIDLGTVFAILIIIFSIGVSFDYLLKKLRFWFFPYTKLQLRK
jgi:ABC-type nitrate/sulfonate/bicarbonate transport system permease component